VQTLFDLEFERTRIINECDYFAVHRIGRKTRIFIANVLARDEAEALRVAKRQSFSCKTKDRTFWHVERIGLSGYAAAVQRTLV
jgi:hypothetical protein